MFVLFSKLYTIPSLKIIVKRSNKNLFSSFSSLLTEPHSVSHGARYEGGAGRRHREGAAAAAGGRGDGDVVRGEEIETEVATCKKSSVPAMEGGQLPATEATQETMLGRRDLQLAWILPTSELAPVSKSPTD